MKQATTATPAAPEADKKQQPVDIVANLTVVFAMLALLLVYCSVALLPPWDDGTGMQLPLSDPAALQKLKQTLSSQHAERWVASLRFENADDSGVGVVASLLDDSMQLGRLDVVRIRYCGDCPCSSAADSSTSLLCAASLQEREAKLRKKALLSATDMESAAFSRLVSKLQHYYQTNAGVDVLFNALFMDGQVDVENASVETRHTRWIPFQPRLPPLSASSAASSSSSLVFSLAERDERWVHDLSVDAQANALRHAPFVFPISLLILTSLVRVFVGIAQRVKRRSST